MAINIELTEAQQEALSNSKECKPLLDYGTEVPAQVALDFLSSKSQATQDECAEALGYKDKTQKLLGDLKAMVKPAPPSDSADAEPVKQDGKVEKPASEEGSLSENGDLPLAPTTAFNVMRLVQLGYFPKDFAPLWGEKPGMFHKGVQGFYVLPGRLGEWARTKANTAFQKKYDRDAAYKDFMLDLTKQMNAELEDWFKQNKLSNKANIDEARQSLEAMKTSLTAGNNNDAMTHFDTLTEKMGMRVNGKWHEKSPADLAATRAEQDSKTMSAENRVDLRKQVQTRRASLLEGQKTDLKDAKKAIDTHYAEELPKGNTVDEKFRADDIKPADIDTEIRRLQTKRAVLENHTVALNVEPIVRDAVAGRSFADIETSRNDIGYSHSSKADIYLPAGSRLEGKQSEINLKSTEIRSYDGPLGHIEVADKYVKNQAAYITELTDRVKDIDRLLVDKNTGTKDKIALKDERAIIIDMELGDARTELETMKGKLDIARTNKSKAELALTTLENQKRNLLTQSEQNKIAHEWFQKRMGSIAQIELKIDSLNRLKPLIEARNKSARKLASTEKSVAGSDSAVIKREQFAREAHAKASPIHDTLDKLTDPSISRSDRLAMNDKLNELLAAKNPEAERIERLLKGTQAEKNQGIRELQTILDARGRGVDFFKTSLEGIEGKIKGLQGEAARIMTEYDRQAGTGDVEALRKKMEVEIGKINTEIERYNSDARVKYGAAAATLTPVQMESLHLQTKLGGFFDLMNKGVIKAESLGAKPVAGKAMRGVYGAMTLAGLGQIGVTTANSGIKQGAIDAADLGVGFIPVVGGVYDIVVGAGQLVKGSELTSDREVSKTDALKRVGFGVLGLIPIAGQAFKAAAKGEKLVEVARKVAVVERAANVTGKVLILNEAKNLGVALYDATGSIVAERGGITKTAESIYTGTRFPTNNPN